MNHLRNVMMLLLGLLATSTGYAQSELTKGSWYNKDKNSRIQFVSQDGQVNARIVWIQANPDALDTKNPNPSLQKRKLLGATIFQQFKQVDAKNWTGGRIYNPDSGKTYDAKLKLINPTTVEVRGYVGTPLLGRTETFTRAD